MTTGAPGSAPDISGVMDAGQAVAEFYGRYVLDKWAYEHGVIPTAPDAAAERARVEALQQAAEQACYRYAVLQLNAAFLDFENGDQIGVYLDKIRLRIAVQMKLADA